MPADMTTVLSIQSWVACGNVGNNAALFPLQRLGCETWSLNTVAFSNHTGYERWRGDKVPASEIANLFEGIAELGVLSRCDAVLSRYLGEADTGPVPIEATGCGDAVAALFLGWLLKGKPLPEALAATISAIYGVIEATMRGGGGELALVAAQEELVAPSRTILPQPL